MIKKYSLKCLLTLTVINLMIGTSEAASKAPPVATKEESEMSFWDLPNLKSAFIDTSPQDRTDGLEVAALTPSKNNKAMIMQLAQELGQNKHGLYDSLLIAHQDKLVFESYFNRGRVDLPHFQSSGTKSVTSLLLARAIQLGHITLQDLKKPLIGFLSGLDKRKFVDGVGEITLHQALSMRSGLRFTDKELKNFRDNPEIFKGIAQVQAFFEKTDVISAESRTYKYQGVGPIMVMQVIDAVVPGGGKDFATKELFNKLGINNLKWRSDSDGLLFADSGASFTSRDMIKLGQLVLNKGRWNGEQLLSAEYLRKATQALAQANESWQPESFFYGYLWYQTDVKVNNTKFDVKVAWGAGGNRIILVDKLDLVVVITGHDMEDQVFDQIANKIIPAFMD